MYNICKSLCLRNLLTVAHSILVVHLLRIPFGRGCLGLGNVKRDSTRRFAIPKQLESDRCISVLEEVTKALIVLRLLDDLVAEEATASEDLDFNPRGLHGIKGYPIIPNGNILAVLDVLGNLRLLRESVSLYADVKLSTE